MSDFNRYGLIFDANVELQDVTLADADSMYQEVVQGMEQGSAPLVNAAAKAGDLAGTQLAVAMRTKLAQELGKGGIANKLATSLEDTLKTSVARMDMNEVGITAKLESSAIEGELLQVINTVGDAAGAVLGTKLSKSVSGSLNKSIGQISGNLEKKVLGLKGKLDLDKTELASLTESGVNLPVHLQLADAVTKQVTDDVQVNLKVKNYSVIQKSLKDLFADVQLTEGAKAALEQLQSIPKEHTLELKFKGTKTLDKVYSQFGKLTTLTLDASGFNYQALESGAKDAGARAGSAAAQSFARTWRRVMQTMDFKLDVAAKIARVEAPASTPTIGVKAQTEQVAQTVAEKTVQTAKRESQKQPRQEAGKPQVTLAPEAPVTVSQASSTPPSVPFRRTWNSPAKQASTAVGKEVIQQGTVTELRGDWPAQRPTPVSYVGRNVAPGTLSGQAWVKGITGDQRLTSELQFRSRRIEPGFVDADKVMKVSGVRRVETSAGMRQWVAAREADPKRQEQREQVILTNRLKNLGRATRQWVTDAQGKTQELLAPAMLQLSGEVMEAYSRSRSAGIPSNNIRAVSISEDVARQVEQLAAAHGAKVTLPRDKQTGSVTLPIETAHSLIGPKLNGSSMGALERMYQGRGDGSKFYVHSNNTLKNTLERNMLSGAVTRNLSSLQTPGDFVEMYRREFETDRVVEGRNGEKVSAFAGPVYDWRFTQMAAATGYLNSVDLDKYHGAMLKAKNLSNPKMRQAAEENATKLLQSKFQVFLTERLGMPLETAKNYASYVQPERVQQAVERFTTRKNGQSVLLEPEMVMQKLLSSALYGEVNTTDSMIYSGSMPTPATYEERSMHAALSRDISHVARTSPRFESLGKFHTAGSMNMDMGAHTEAQREWLSTMVGQAQQASQRVIDAPDYLHKMGLALADITSVDDVRHSATKLHMASILDDLGNVQDLPLAQAHEKVRQAALRVQKLHRDTVVWQKNNAPGFKGTLPFTSAMVFNGNNAPLAKLSAGEALDDNLLTALEQTGLHEMSVSRLGSLDATQQIYGGTIRQMMLQYANAVRTGDIDKADSYMSTPVRRIPKATYTNENGKVTVSDKIITLRDIIEGQQEVFDWGSATFARENELLATGVNERVRGFKYDARSTMHSTDLTVAKIAAQNPELAGRIAATLPGKSNGKHHVQSFIHQLQRNGFKTDNMTAFDAALASRAEYESAATKLTAEEFLARNMGTLSARFPDIAHLLDVDEVGRPLVVGPDYEHGAVYAPIGKKGAHFALKPGAQTQFNALVEAQAKRDLEAGNGTLTGAMDARIGTLLDNIGFHYDTADGNSSAYKYDGTLNADGSPNYHFVGDAPDHIQEMLKARDFIMRDPVAAAEHYIGMTVKPLTEEIETLKAKKNAGTLTPADSTRLESLVKRREPMRKLLAGYKAGTAVNPFEVMKHVKLYIPGVQNGMSAHSFMAQASNPQLQAAIQLDGDEAGEEFAYIDGEDNRRRTTRLFSDYLQVRTADGLTETHSMTLRGPLQTDLEAIRLLGDKKLSGSTVYKQIADRVRSHANTLSGKGLTAQEGMKFAELTTALYDLSSADARNLAPNERQELRQKYGQLASELTPLLGTSFAQQAKMYGLGYQQPGFNPDELTDGSVNQLLQQTAKMGNNAPQSLRQLYHLQAGIKAVSSRGAKLKVGTPEQKLNTELRKRLAQRISEMEARLSQMGVEPALTPVSERVVTDADVENAMNRRAYGQQQRARKVEVQLPQVEQVPAPKNLRGSESTRRVRVGEAQRINIGTVLTDELKALHAARDAARSEQLNGKAADAVQANTVGDRTGDQAKQVAQAARKTVELERREAKAAGQELAKVKAGDLVLKLDLGPLEASMKKLLTSLADIAQITQRKLQQVLDGVAGLTVDHSKFRPRQPGDTGDTDEAAADGNNPSLFRPETPYIHDNKLNRDVLTGLTNDVASGKLSIDEYFQRVEEELNRARAGYPGSSAQTGAAASVAGDRLREEERARAVKVLGPANVTQKDFYKYAMEPAKYTAARQLTGIAKRENIPLEKLVQSVMPSIRNISQYDPEYIRGLVSDRQFLDLVRAGKTAQASQRLGELKNGGQSRKDFLMGQFQDPTRFQDAASTFGYEFLETALNPNAAKELAPKAQQLLQEYLSGALDRNTAKRAGQDLLREFNQPKSAGTKFNDLTRESESLTRKSFIGQVFAQSELYKSGTYGQDFEQALSGFFQQDPTMAETFTHQLNRLKPYHGTMGAQNRQVLAEQLDLLVQARSGIQAGTHTEEDFQAQAVQFENQVTGIRNGERIRGNFMEYLRNPLSATVGDKNERLAYKQMSMFATPKEIRAVQAGDTNKAIELADRQRHVQERIKMAQAGVTNMAAFVAGSLIQSAVTGIMQGLMEQETALRAVRAAVNMSGGTIPRDSVLREQGGKIATAMGVTRAEALTLLAQTAGDNSQQTVADMVKLRGILNATGETTAELTAFYGGLQSAGIQDRASVIKNVVSTGMSLKQAEENRKLVEDGLKNYGSDKDKTLVIVGAQQVSGLKDWKLSDSTLVRERQMERLAQYGSEAEFGKAQTSLPMDRLQLISAQFQETLGSVARALEPLIAFLGATAMGVLKLTKGVADFVNMTGPIGKLVASMAVLGVAIKALVATMEWAAVRGLVSGMFGKKGAAGAAAGTAQNVAGSVAGGVLENLIGNKLGTVLSTWSKTFKGGISTVANTNAGIATRVVGSSLKDAALGSTVGILAQGAWMKAGDLFKNTTRGTKLLAGGWLKDSFPLLFGDAVKGATTAQKLSSAGMYMKNAVLSGGIHTINGIQTAGRFVVPALRTGLTGARLATVGATAARIGLGLSNPVGWAVTAGTIAYELANWQKNKKKAETEKVTQMSASGVGQQGKLDELAAAYSGELTPAMEAAGYSAEEVRKRIDEMAEKGKGKTKELAQEVQKLARDYQLAGEFAKSLGSNLQTRIPFMTEQYKNNGIIPVVTRKDTAQVLSRALGVQTSVGQIDAQVYDALTRSGQANWKAKDDEFFKSMRGFFAGNEQRNWFGNLFNVRSASEVYKYNSDIREKQAAQHIYDQVFRTQAAVQEAYTRLPGGGTGNNKAPSYWRMKYNEWDSAGNGSRDAGAWGNWWGARASGVMRGLFGYGRDTYTDSVIMRETVGDRKFDTLASIFGIQAGREQSLAAIQEQFRTEGLKDFSQKSLDKLAKNPKAYTEVMKLLADVNKQESEQYTALYQNNIQDAVLRATAPGVLSHQVYDERTGKGTLTKTTLGALANPERFAQDMLYNQGGLQLRQAEAKRDAVKDNLKSMNLELVGMQQNGLIDKLEQSEGVVTGFTVNLEKLKGVAPNVRERLLQLESRVAEAGGELGQLAQQIRQLRLEDIIKGALGVSNLASVQTGEVSLSGVLSGNQQLIQGTSPVQGFIAGLQQANWDKGSTPSGSVSTKQAAAIMQQKLGASNTYQLPNEDKTGFYHGKGHPGYDFNYSTRNAPIKSLTDGKVIAVGIDPNQPGYGLRALVDAGNGYVHAYSHLSGTSVKVGNTVKAGQALGTQGGGKGQYGAGASTGYHLDYSLYYSDGKGGTKGKALRDTANLAKSGALSTNGPIDRKLDAGLQALQENAGFRKLDAQVMQLPNRVAALREKFEAKEITQEQYDAGLNKIVAEGYIYVDGINQMVANVFKQAGKPLPDTAKMDKRLLMAGIIGQSGAGAEFEKLAKSSGASQQVVNLMKNAQVRAAIEATKRSGDGTLLGNTKAVATGTQQEAVVSANETFVNAVSSAAQPIVEELARKYGMKPGELQTTRKTADGYTYTGLSDKALSKLTQAEQNRYRNTVSAAETTRKTAVSAAGYQFNVSQEQAAVQDFEQKLAEQLAAQPRNEVDKIQFQINQQQAFLKKNPGLNQDAKLDMNNKLAELKRQLVEAKRGVNNQKADQSIANQSAQNEIISGQTELSALLLENSGDGTLADNRKKAREAAYSRAINSAEDQYLATMQQLGQSFRTKYTNTPESAYEVRKTASGKTYSVLKAGYAEQFKDTEYSVKAQAAQQKYSAAQQAANIDRNRDAGQTSIELAERELNRKLAGQELLPVKQTQYALDYWKNYLKRMGSQLDQNAELVINTKIEDLTNQLASQMPEFKRLLSKTRFDARAVTNNLAKSMGGKVASTDYQIQGFQADTQIAEMEKVLGKNDPLIQAAWKQANRMRLIAPTLDGMTSTVEQGKIDSIGKQGYLAFTTQNTALNAAQKLAEQGKLTNQESKAVLREELARREEQLRQYELLGKQAVIRQAAEKGTLDILGRQNAITRTLTNGSLADQLIARVQRDNEKQQSKSEYDNAVLNIVTERDQATYSADGLKLLADQLGVKYDPKLDYSQEANYQKLNTDVAQARKGEAQKLMNARNTQADKNFAVQSAQRLASLLEQPLSRYEGMSNRMQAIDAAAANTPEELKAPLMAQLNALKVGAASFGEFDSVLSTVRDQVALGKNVSDAGATKLYGELRSMPENMKNFAAPALAGLLDKTEAAAKFRVAQAQETGNTISGQLDLNTLELDKLSLAYGGKTQEALLDAAMQDIQDGKNLDTAGRITELFKNRRELKSQLTVLEEITAPMNQHERNIQDAERLYGRDGAQEARQAALEELTGNFQALSKGQGVEAVLSMNQEELNSLYGKQADGVKALAEFLRTLGIEIQKTTEEVEAETRARQAQTAQRNLERELNRNGSAGISAQFAESSKDMESTMRGLLLDNTDQNYRDAVEAVKNGDQKKLTGLVQKGTAQEFSGYVSQYDNMRNSAVQAYMTARVREQTRSDSANLAELTQNPDSVNLALALGNMDKLMQDGQGAARTAFDEAFKMQGGSIQDGKYTLDGKTFQSQQAVLDAYRNDTGTIGTASRFVLENSGGLTALGTQLNEYLPVVQGQVDLKTAQGDYAGAQGDVQAAYAALVLLVNKLLAATGETFQFDSNLENAPTEQIRAGTARVGMGEGGKQVLDTFGPGLKNIGTVVTRDVTGRAGEARIADIERKYAANQPLYRSERAMLKFEQDKLAETNQMLLSSGTVQLQANGQVTGPQQMVDIYQKNLKRMTDITKDMSYLLVKQWNDMFSQMVEDTKGAITDGLTLLVSEALTGQHYRQKVKEIDRNMDNRVENAESNLAVYEENKKRAAEKMREAAKQGTGSQAYLDAKQEYEFYNQKILEMKDNVQALNTEWQQQKFELKTIGEMLLDIFNNLANQILNKTISRFVDFGLDALFGAVGNAGGSGGGTNFLGGLLGGLFKGASGAAAGGYAQMAGSPSIGPALPAGGLTTQAAGASGNVLGIQGLTNGAVGGAMTAAGVTASSGNPLIGIGVGAAQMAVAGGVAGVAAAGGSMAAFGPAAMAALTNPVGWAALAVGGAIGMIVSVAKDHQETARRQHIADMQGVSMYGLKPGQFAHGAGTQPQVVANVQVQSLADFSTSRTLSQKMATESKLQATKQGLLGVPS